PSVGAVCTVVSRGLKPSDGLKGRLPPHQGGVPLSLDQLGTASVVQASGFRRDVIVFRLNAARAGDSGLEPAFGRNTAERVYLFEAAHNPEVAGSNPAPLLQEVRKCSPFVSGSRAANATAHLRGPRSRSRPVEFADSEARGLVNE